MGSFAKPARLQEQFMELCRAQRGPRQARFGDDPLRGQLATEVAEHSRSSRPWIGIRSAPPTEMKARCAIPARFAAATRMCALISSLGASSAVDDGPMPSRATSMPSPVARSPVNRSIPRLLCPAAC